MAMRCSLLALALVCGRAEEAAEACATEEGDSGSLLQLKSKEEVYCTEESGDPYRHGWLLPCCAGLQKCLGPWHSKTRYSYRCLRSCSREEKPPKQPAPPELTPVQPTKVPPLKRSDLSTCLNTTALDQNSVWQMGTSANSCSGGIRGDGASACINERGEVDRSSLFVDMRGLKSKVGCFEWVTDECLFSMKSLQRLDFDVEWKDCGNLWMAPLWTYSSPWVGPQGRSGEIDLVEECPVPHVATNLGCYDANVGSRCKDGHTWGDGGGSDGPRHLTMTMDDDGNLEVKVCTAVDDCKVVASYLGYLGTVYPTTGGRDNLYHFVSDIWNDHAGDGGWSGCRAVQNSVTNCRYAVTNIRVASKSGSPMFDEGSKCASMNAAQ